MTGRMKNVSKCRYQERKNRKIRQEKGKRMLKNIKVENVKILPGLFRERMDLNRDYLLELDNQCLLQNFYLEAGIILPGLQIVEDPGTANMHWGWEAPNCQLRGHFLGHWMSAAAYYVASENDKELKVKLDTIVEELGKCQELNGGEWVGSIPEKYFEKLAKNQYIWSPQYVMHKTIMGLMHAYQYAGNEQALAILDKLSDWYIRWTAAMQEVNPHAVYSGEEGGMLELWATLYEITKNEKYMTLVERYYAPGLFRRLQNGADALSNCHANASIPLSHGAAKMYEITGDEKWREVVELFWQEAVTKRGMYCTTGQNAGEFWIPPHMQGRFMGDRTQEFCTVYNMVRTASYLLKWTGDKQYADYIERCLYNGFLAQQNSKTGMPTYFLPLRAGAHKKWGTRTRDFWCCYGTMVQAQSMYPELVYLEDEDNDRLVVSQYIPSALDTEWKGNTLHLEQTTGMKYYNDQAFFDEHDDSQMSRWTLKFQVEMKEAGQFTIAFRVPAWVKGEVKVWMNGEETAPVTEDGYLLLNREWKQDTVQIFFPNELETESLPDMPELTAILDGPIVLAGLVDYDCGLTMEGKKAEEVLEPQFEHTYETFPWQQNHYCTRGQERNFYLKPLYEVTDEAYTVYFSRK